MKVFKYTISIITLLVYSTLVFRTIVPLIDYALNYDFIKKELCLQKDNPESNCKGTCYLTNQIKNQSESTPEIPIMLLEEFNNIPHIASIGNYKANIQKVKKDFCIIKYQIKQFNLKPLTPPPKPFYFI